MLARFMGGLNREIQTILEYNNITRLFHLACKAKREVLSWRWWRSYLSPQYHIHILSKSNGSTTAARLR